jgi:hypothetical protein
VAVGDFVVVVYHPVGKRKSQVYYVGSVIESALNGNGWKINLMRRHRTATNSFVFPPHDDVNEYLWSDVIRIMSKPKIVRLVHFFQDDMSAYTSHLH